MSTLRFPAIAAATTLAVLCGGAHAALTAYTSQASFAAATASPATDTFATLPIDFVVSPSTRSAGSYGYTAAASGGLFGAGSAANPWLSTNLSGDTLTFAGFTGGVQALGGLFFGADIAGAFLGGQTLTLTAVDSLGASLVQGIADATQSSFVGFVSSAALVSVSVDIAARSAYAAADNLVLAQGLAVQAIPEPETYALLLGGIALMAAMKRRRQPRQA